MRAIRHLAASFLGLAVLLLSGSGGAQAISVLAASTPLDAPQGILVDSAGNLYVANAYGPGGIGAAVLKMTPGGEISTIYANPASAGLTQFSAIALDGSGNLYIADTNHNQVLSVTPGGVASVLVDSSNGIVAPAGLAFDRNFNLYVSNSDANTITEVTAGGAVSTFVESGAGLSAPRGLAFDAAGNLYIANSAEGPVGSGDGANTISKVTPTGDVSTFVPASARLFNPFVLAFDPSGNLVEADINNVLHAITPAGVVSTIDNTHFSEPRGLAFDPSGDLIVSDQRTNAISRVTAADSVTIILQGNLNNPQYPVFDEAGNLYLADVNTVRKIAPNGAVSTFVAAGQGLASPLGLAYHGDTLYVANFSSNSISKISVSGAVSSFVSGSPDLVNPEGLAFDAAGNLYASTGFGTIAKITPDGSVSTLVGASAGLLKPRGLAFDTSGTLYVAELGSRAGGAAISKVTPSGVVTRFVTGQLDPYGLAFDRAGNLYVASTVGLIYEIAPSGAMSVAVQNQAGGTTPQLVQPLGLAFDSGGRLDVVDVGSNSILQIGVGASPIAAAVLPGARAVELGTAATVFATMSNASDSPLSDCGIGLSTRAPAGLTLSFQTTDPTTNAVTGTANAPVTLPAHGAQSFVLAFQSDVTVGFVAPGVQPMFNCQNVTPASSIAGVDTVDLTFSETPIADIIALAAVASNDGTMHVANNVGAFAVATIDAGAAAPLTVSVDTGSTVLPLALALCQTNASGQCLAPPASVISVSFVAGGTPTFSVFATANGTIPFDPANSRVFVRFTDAASVSHGSTSVAVTTN